MSGGVFIPQLAGELSLLRFGAITKLGFDVCTKRVSIRRRCHKRVIDVYVHLTEERVEPVVHRCHLCISGEVGTVSSNNLSSNEQVGVGKIEVGISGSRQHEFNWTPESRRQRLVFYLATIIDTRLRRWHGEKV